MITGLFWLSTAVLTETYIVFPAVVLGRGRWRARPHLEGDITPTVSVVVAVHDEVEVIEAKIRSVLDGDYPPELLEVIVASDGSTDGTEITADVGDPRVQVLTLGRVGKAQALNAATAAATGEIVVFTDANSHFAQSTLRHLVRGFADPEVGGVAGDQRYLPAGSAVTHSVTGHGETGYWDFDRALKLAESRSGNVIGATGALYAVRRDLVEPLPDGVTDDFTTSTGVIAAGRRLVFAADATVYEPVSASAGAEYRRKVRVMSRGLRAVAYRRALLNPARHGFYSYQLLNHKVLRRLMALPLLTLAVASGASLQRGWAYRMAFAAQAAIYVPGAIALAYPKSRLGRSRPFGLAGYFCMVNAAGAVAAWQVATGQRIHQWTPERVEVPTTDPKVGPRPERNA